mmetsp:Transcript_27555/g.77532  ORF Transcript_27555/g.77532 Transcript_27555/m.77532 type:complete len:214 (+) Transcript_27555:69-710(+)
MPRIGPSEPVKDMHRSRPSTPPPLRQLLPEPRAMLPPRAPENVAAAPLRNAFPFWSRQPSSLQDAWPLRASPLQDPPYGPSGFAASSPTVSPGPACGSTTRSLARLQPSVLPEPVSVMPGQLVAKNWMSPRFQQQAPSLDGYGSVHKPWREQGSGALEGPLPQRLVAMPSSYGQGDACAQALAYTSALCSPRSVAWCGHSDGAAPGSIRKGVR